MTRGTTRGSWQRVPFQTQVRSCSAKSWSMLVAHTGHLLKGPLAAWVFVPSDPDPLRAGEVSRCMR